MLRGIERRRIFQDDVDRDNFLNRLYAPGKYPKVVQARSVFCYWAVRELGVSATALAKKLRVTQPAISIAVKRGEKIAKDKGYEFLEG